MNAGWLDRREGRTYIGLALRKRGVDGISTV